MCCKQLHAPYSYLLELTDLPKLSKRQSSQKLCQTYKIVNGKTVFVYLMLKNPVILYLDTPHLLRFLLPEQSIVPSACRLLNSFTEV